MADDKDPPKDRFPPLKMTAIVHGGHSIMTSGQLESFVAYCREHGIKFYVSREKLPLLSRYFMQGSVTDEFTMTLRLDDNGCPPPTFECPQIDN